MSAQPDHQSPWATAEIDMFRDTARRFIANEIAPHAARFREQQHVDREVWQKAGQLGLLLPDIPKRTEGAAATSATRPR